MPTHAAFLRAVNLGGHRRASSAGLRATFERAGFAEVATFRASGNVVFAADGSEKNLKQEIESALEQSFGFVVPVYLRAAGELSTLAATDGIARIPGRKLQVALLERPPSARVREQVLAHATDEDLLAFADRELLWLPAGGTQRSNLNLRAIEQLTGPWTMRTMDTIEQIVARHFR